MKKKLLYGLAVINLLLIFVLWWRGSGEMFTQPFTGSVFIALGRLAGLLAEFSILILLVIIGRITWIEQLFGHDKMSQLHRWVGYSIGFFFLTHPILLTIGYAESGQLTLVQQFISFAFDWDEVFGAIVGLFVFALVIVMSVPAVRRRLRYETWHFMHLGTYIAIAMAFEHQIVSGDMSGAGAIYYWYAINYAVFGLLLLYRFLRPLYLFYRHQFRVEKIVEEAPDIFSVYILGKNMERFAFKAGQFANIMFLAKGFLQPHPFSFSAAPNGQSLRFSIKSLGDFTSKIQKLKTGTYVLIDGPLGVFTESAAKKDKYLFLAGGIGITPIRSLIESLVEKQKNIVLIYGCKNKDELVFQKEFTNLMSVCRGQLACHIALSNVVEEPTPGFEQGYIDAEKIKRLAPDYLERDIYLCGPPPMTTSVVRALDSMGVNKNRIHFEKFSY